MFSNLLFAKSNLKLFSFLNCCFLNPFTEPLKNHNIHIFNFIHFLEIISALKEN